MIAHDLNQLASAKCDVCIIGSGPVGSALAVDLVRRGLTVIVLESGLAAPDKQIQSLSDAIIGSPRAHHPMDLAVSRSLGGSSRLWGGRCVFLDKIDFERREYVPGSGWPIDFGDLASHLPRAAELLGCNDGGFKDSDWHRWNDPDVETASLERWVNELRTLRGWPELKTSKLLKVFLDATAVGIGLDPDGRAIKGICVARKERTVTFTGANFYVLAQGGVETARLLLNVQATHPRAFGGAATNLGRNYMGHLSGSLASIRFFNPDMARYFAHVEGPKSFARRRFTLSSNSQRIHQLPNVSFWPENTTYSDPDHASGILSAASLTLRLPGVGPRLVAQAIRNGQNHRQVSIWPHLKNVLRDPYGLLTGAAEVVRQRVRYGRQLPRLFVTNRGGIYPLRFHSEQYPDAQNAIRLSNERDWLGVRRAIIDFKFSAEQMARVIDAHKLLDRGLRRLNIGELIYHDSPDRLDPTEQVENLAPDGLHQIGLTRMASRASAGVVDPNCRVFEFENLFIASSSIFPTSGQATPTLPTIALAVRLSTHIAEQIDRLRMPAARLTTAPKSRRVPAAAVLGFTSAPTRS